MVMKAKLTNYRNTLEFLNNTFFLDYSKEAAKKVQALSVIESSKNFK